MYIDLEFVCNKAEELFADGCVTEAADYSVRENETDKCSCAY